MTRLVEAEADLFVLGADRHAVVGHDLAGAGVEGRLERLAGAARTGRRGRPARGRRRSAGPRRPSAVRRRGSAWSSSRPSRRRASRPGTRGCRRRRAAPVSSASSPKVATWRAQRGSVARSTCGCRATRMPTAMYSWRAMSAKRSHERPRRGSRRGRAVSGHCENGPASIAAPRVVAEASGAGRSRSSPGCRGG